MTPTHLPIPASLSRAAATSEQLVERLNALGGLEVRDGGATRGTVTVRTLGETLEAATHVVAGAPGARLADMFAGGSGPTGSGVSPGDRVSPRASRAADNGGDAPTLRLVWALESGYLLTEPSRPAGSAWSGRWPRPREWPRTRG